MVRIKQINLSKSVKKDFCLNDRDLIKSLTKITKENKKILNQAKPDPSKMHIRFFAQQSITSY